MRGGVHGTGAGAAIRFWLNLSAASLEGAVLTVLMVMGLWASTRSKSELQNRSVEPSTRVSQCDEVGSNKINSNSHMNPVSGAQIALFSHNWPSLVSPITVPGPKKNRRIRVCVTNVCV